MKSNHHIIKLFILFFTLLTLLAIISCTSPAPASPTAPVSSTTAIKQQYGGALKIITLSAPLNIGCPWEPRSPNDVLYSQPAMETFLRIDEKGLPAPWLAESWTMSPDGKDITFKLRKVVKFHDGTDFNAEAAKYNLDMLKNSTFIEYKVISSVDIIDDYTIRVSLSSYNTNFMSALGLARIVSPAAAKQYGKDWMLSNAVGTGPFKFVSYTRDVSIKFTKFDGYWQKGKPYLDTIEWVQLSDPTVALMSFQKGETNIFTGILAKDAIELQKNSNFKVTSSVAGMYGLAGDNINASSPFANLKVRQAVSYAIDNKAISTAIGPLIYPPAVQPFPSTSWSYNPSVVGYPFNPAKSKALLSEAGYPNGFTAKVIFQTGAPRDIAYTAVQAYLKAVGIDAILDAQGSGAFTQTRDKGWSNALIAYENPTGVGMEPNQALSTRLSGIGRFVSIKPPEEYQAKLNNANVEPNFEKRKTMVQDLMKMVIDQYAMINPIYYVHSSSAKTLNVQDETLFQIWTQQWTPENAWLSK